MPDHYNYDGAERRIDGRGERRNDYFYCVDNLKKGKYVDWKILIGVIFAWLLTLVIPKINDHYDIRANTQFREQAGPIIVEMQADLRLLNARLDTTNKELHRIATQLENLMRYYMRNPEKSDG